MKDRITKNFNRTTAVIICIVLIITGSLLMFFFFQMKVNSVSDQKKGSKYYQNHYAFITSDSQDVFFNSIYQAAKDEGEKKDDYIEYLGRDLAVDYSKTQLVDIAIASKVNGIILEADETQETIDAIDRAEKAGIPVITVGSDCTGSMRQSYVGISNYSLGQEYGKQALTHVSDDVKKVLVLMNPNADDSSQNIIYTAIKEQLAQSADGIHFEVETFAIDDTSTFGAEESIRDIIMNENRLPDILICLNELNTNCAYQAVVDYNKVGQVSIFGYYMNDSILDAIDKEIVSCSIAIDTKQMGKYCVDALDEYRNYGYVNEFMPVDIKVIKQSNVKEFMDDEE